MPLYNACRVQGLQCHKVFTCSVALQLKGVPASRLSTKLLEDPHNVAAYASFLVARKVVSTTLVRHVAAIRKVLAWRASLGGSSRAHAVLQEVLKWTDKLQRQCQHAATPPVSNMQRTKLPHAREVLKWQLVVQHEADSLLAEDLQRKGALDRQETARAVQDAAFLDMSFGYLPTPRLACLR